MFGLHYKRKLPACFYRMFTPRWKPVMSTDEYPEVEDDDDKEKHPSIIKNNGDITDLNVSELGPMGDGANINNDLTTVTWTSDEKDEEENTKEEKIVDEKVVEDEKEKEKKEDEKEEKATEDTPLQDEENLK